MQCYTPIVEEWPALAAHLVWIIGFGFMLCLVLYRQGKLEEEVQALKNERRVHFL